MTHLALDHRLVSQYTSFVAVSDRVVNRGGKTETIAVPQALPEGVTERALGGGVDKRTSGLSSMSAVSSAPAGGSTETRSAAWAPSAPGAVMSASVMRKVLPAADGLLGEDADPSNTNAVDVILAGGGGSVKKGERGPHSEGDRMQSLGGVGLGAGGRGGAADQAPRAKLAAPEPTDMECGGDVGMRSPESILRVIRQHMGAFRGKYEQARKANPGLGAKLSIRFTIGPDGKIVQISVVSSSTGDAAFDAAIREMARRMKFDAIERGNVTVTYALQLDRN